MNTKELDMTKYTALSDIQKRQRQALIMKYIIMVCLIKYIKRLVCI